MALVSHDTYYRLKYFVTSALPLNDWLVFSLPEGLWVFCITITSGMFYVKTGERSFGLGCVPIFIAIVMELFQLFGITNGRFDWMDIVFSGIFWVLALIWIRDEPEKRLVWPFNFESAICVTMYSIVYLAHVCY